MLTAAHSRTEEEDAVGLCEIQLSLVYVERMFVYVGVRVCVCVFVCWCCYGPCCICCIYLYVVCVCVCSSCAVFSLKEQAIISL